MRHREEFHAEEARIVFDVFHHHFRVTQRVRRLQLIARIGHLRDQTANPGVQLKLQQTTVFGRTDIFTLDQFQIMGDA